MYQAKANKGYANFFINLIILLDLYVQVRLDFNTFVISGPSTLSTSVGELLNGVLTPNPGAGLAVSSATQCLTDTFTITNQASLPMVCGTLSGQHSKLCS